MSAQVEHAAALVAGLDQAPAVDGGPASSVAGGDLDRSSWLRWRRNGLGGSDIAAILGLSPWASPWSVWADKVGLTPIDESDAEHLEFGRRAEPMLATWFHDRTRLYVAGEQTCCEHPDHPWMRVTVDGFAFDGNVADEDQRLDVVLGFAGRETAAAAVEFKTTQDSVKSWEDDGPPVYYQTQAIWTSIVTGIPVVWFAVLHMSYGRPQFRTYEFHFDLEDRELVEKKAREFWEGHVLTGTPPPVDASDATCRALNTAWITNGESVEADDVDVINVEELRRLKAEAKALEEQISLRENAIKAALAEATVLTRGLDSKDRPVVLATWKSSPSSRIDTKAIRVAHPDLCAEFTKTSESRRFLLKTTKGE